MIAGSASSGPWSARELCRDFLGCTEAGVLLHQPKAPNASNRRAGLPGTSERPSPHGSVEPSMVGIGSRDRLCLSSRPLNDAPSTPH